MMFSLAAPKCFSILESETTAYSGVALAITPEMLM